MSDRDLLEKAAKAAGHEFTHDPEGPGLLIGVDGKAAWLIWNPLADDGDAFRLAAKRQLHAARTSRHRVSCWAEKSPFDTDEDGHDTHSEVSECWFGEEMREYAARYGHNWRADQLAATRLAIVLAAAMEEKT